MKTGAEKVLEWFNKFESQNGTPTPFEIKSQLQMAVDEEEYAKQSRQADVSGSLPDNYVPHTTTSEFNNKLSEFLSGNDR